MGHSGVFDTAGDGFRGIATMGMRLQAFKEFIQRYSSVWKQVWAVRDQLDPPKRERDEREFMPAHLELTETPLSAAPKWAARLVILFALIALLWAIFGKLDIVAVAQGKTSLGGRSKTIQALETAVVERINVKDGQTVKKGEVLLELAGIGSDSDYNRSLEALRAAYLNKWRSETLLAAIENGHSPRLSSSIDTDKQDAATHNQDNTAASAAIGLQAASVSQNLKQQIIASIPQSAIIEAQTLVLNQYQAWATKDQQLASVKDQRIAERASTQAQISKLAAMTQIEGQRVSDYRELVAQDYLAKHSLLEQESKYIQAKNDLASQQSTLQQIAQAIKQAEDERLLNTQTIKRDTLDVLRQANEQIGQLEPEAEKAEQRKKLMTLTAPVDGTVQQLAMHTIGGVVTAAQPIMVIVPSEDKLEIEAIVPNKDIGFVQAGQEVVVKIESFPYTRYGYLTGKVKTVSFDAVENKDLGLVYTAIVFLDHDTLNIEGKPVRLDAGMNATAEIKTGKRSVISYLLSPLQTKVDESLRER